MNFKHIFRRRMNLLLLLFAVWLALAMARAFYFSVPGRAEALQRGEESAKISGVLLAPRGRILDAKGAVLAWSERYFDLELLPGGVLTAEERNELQKLLGPDRLSDGEILCPNLTAAEFTALSSLIREKNKKMRISSRIVRMCVSRADLRRILGECAWINGELVGISGIELRYDARLRGSRGQFEVLLDRYRNWIDRSWRLVKNPRPGEDIWLQCDADHLLGQEELL